jgi:outer membrane protein TolC
MHRKSTTAIALLAAGAASLVPGCRYSATSHREYADKVATRIVETAQRKAVARDERFTIERPADTLRRRLLLGQELPRASAASLGADNVEPIPHWPEKGYPVRRPSSGSAVTPWQGSGPLNLTLVQALQVAARNNRGYQARKEEVFMEALDLDLEANEFRHLFSSDVEATYETDLSGGNTVSGLTGTGTLNWQRRLKNGAMFTASIAADLVQLLTQDEASALGLFADATVTVPLLRGAGSHIVTEPLRQAERDVVYALYALERYRRTLAVRVASEYLSVLQQLDQVQNAEENYRRLIASARRARRLADAGRLPEIQVDQARQDELRARNRWIVARQTYTRQLDSFKTTLGLPTDANVDLDQDELKRLADSTRQALPAPPPAQRTAPRDDKTIRLEQPSAKGGRMEIPQGKAVGIAVKRRLDLRTLVNRVVDAQHQVVVAADALRLGLTVTGAADVGERRTLATAGAENAGLRFTRGVYSLGMLLDLPLERTAERNAYRESLIDLERAARDVQELEDGIKLEVRNALRKLLEARESYRIQTQAVKLARRRVASTQLFLQAGRAQIRDILEAQESLVSAQNALTAALVNYRVAELELQRDMGVLAVDEKGLWREYQPE